MAALTMLPDATSIKTRFPEFTTLDDLAVAFAIQEASRQVDDTWIENDQLLAVSLLAAHFLSVASASAGVDGRVVNSETIGPISVSYSTAAAAMPGTSSPLETTSYGKRFLSLLDRNFAGPITVV